MVLKGSSSSRTRTKRPDAFKVEVIRLVRNEQKSAKEALEQAAQTFGLELTESMTKYPASIFDSYQKAVNAKLAKKDAATEQLVRDANLAAE